MESVVYPPLVQPIITFIPAYKADLYEASVAEAAAAAVHQIEYATEKRVLAIFSFNMYSINTSLLIHFVVIAIVTYTIANAETMHKKCANKRFSALNHN